MNRTIYRLKTLISDFFNKIPAIVLIPAILLGSFLIAVLLIWSGTKVAVIDVADPFASNSNTNARKAPAAGNKNSNSEEDLNFGNFGENTGNSDSSKSTGVNGTSQDYITTANPTGSVGTQGSTESGGTSSNNTTGSTINNNSAGSTGAGQTGGGSQGSSSSSSSSGKKEDTEASKRLPSYSYGNSNSNTNANENSNVSKDCTYPSGEVRLWWRRATKLQRDCYISKNGFPSFLADEPYFCDYEKNEDCYVK